MANDSVDIIYATETHLSGETDAELELAEFNIHRRDRPVNGKHGGGVMIAIRKSLDSTCILKGKDFLHHTFVTRRNKPPAVVACAYRPPDNNIEVATAIARDITDIRSKFKKSDFMMGGDFNLPDINWETFEIKGGNYSKNVNQIILDSCSDNGLRLWSHIRSKNKDNVGISDLESGTTLIQDAETKANMFNTFFTKVFSIPDQHVGRAPSKKLPPMPKIQISQAGVLKLLLNIKENKATGPDGIPGNLIKMCAHELAPVFTTLFQASLDQGCVPPDWKMAHIVPVFKKGSKSKVENYRPISLTSITSKLLEHIVHSSVMDHLDDHGYLNCFQW